MKKFVEHRGFTSTFQENKLTLGLAFHWKHIQAGSPEMDLEQQIELAKLAEEANFAALFVRDVPLNDPSFGDVGQMYDPWVFLSYLAAHTQKIALGTGSIVTTLRHPLDLAKSAASVDRISGQRLLFGVATGDRPIEFTAYNVDRENRSDLFRESFHVMKEVWANSFPHIDSNRVHLNGADLLPKPVLSDIPTFITGHSGQSLEWIAKNGDGWINYPRDPATQAEIIRKWRSVTDGFKPFSQSLYIDLAKDPDVGPTPIHLGFRSGYKYLVEFLKVLEAIGVNHVMLNVKFAQRPIADIIQELGEKVVPHFSARTNHSFD